MRDAQTFLVPGRVVREERPRAVAAGQRLRQCVAVQGQVDGLAHPDVVDGAPRAFADVVETHVVVADLERADLNAGRGPHGYQLVGREVEAHVDFAGDGGRGQVARAIAFDLDRVALAVFAIIVVRVRHEVNVVTGDERVDLVRAREHEVRTVPLVDRKDPLGQHRVHDVSAYRGLDANDSGARRRHGHRTNRRLRVGVRRVQLAQAVRDGLRRDVRAVGELVAGFERDVPDELRNFADRLRDLANDLAVLVYRE